MSGGEYVQGMGMLGMSMSRGWACLGLSMWRDGYVWG